MKLKTLSVTEVNRMLSDYIQTNPIFLSINIKGEIVNLRKTNYGYTFFSLKDENSKINCMVDDPFDFENGQEVIASGKISIYKKSGNYTFIVTKIEKSGKGKQSEEFLKLYNDLKEKGYFNEENKKPLKKYPKNIGVITSNTGAAIKDILSVYERKFPHIDVYIYDTKMQGENIKQGIINGFKVLDEMNMDTIIISRGGGESDNLAQFNDYDIAISMFNCKVPTISAIGHEIDFTIPDFIADKRVPTPSIAAEISVPEKNEITNQLDKLINNIKSSYENNIEYKKYMLESHHMTLEKNAPIQKIKELFHKTSFIINEISNIFLNKIKSQIYHNNKVINDISNNYKTMIQENKTLLEKYKLEIELNNPYKILKDGYSLIIKDDSIIKSIKEFKTNSEYTIKFYDGEIKVNISKGRF